MLYFNAKRRTQGIYLGAFCLLISLYILDNHILFFSKSALWISLSFVNITFLFYLIGPMSYWYTRSILLDSIRLKRHDFWHLLPAVIHLTVSLPYIFSPYSHKMEIAKSILADSDFLRTYHATILSDLFPNSVMYLSRPILALLYASASAGLFIHYLTKKKGIFGCEGNHFMIKWLSFFLGLQILFILSHISILHEVFSSASTGLFFALNISQLISLAGLIGLLVAPFFFPNILYGLSDHSIPDAQLKTDTAEILALTPDAKKNLFHFDFDYIVTIIEKMATCMQEQQPYLQPDLNLTQFSAQIQVPAHHLVYFFREVKKQSFNDYRNECRVNHAKMLIRAGKADELTLEAIGLQSGFVTRNTFFTAFKKVEGISPSAYVAKIAR